MDMVSETYKESKIDIHHHIFPPAHLYPKMTLNAKLGWTTPAENLPWTPRKSLEAMDALGIDMAVLSYPAGIPLRQDNSPDSDEADRRTARELNELFWTLTETMRRSGAAGSNGDCLGRPSVPNLTAIHLIVPLSALITNVMVTRVYRQLKLGAISISRV